MRHKKPNNNGGNGNGGHAGHQPRRNNFSHNRNRHGGSNGGGHHRQGGADDARIRKNATASREKYMNMAKDALSSGDRVLAEYYFQHADHFFRVLSELPPEETHRKVIPISSEFAEQSAVPQQEENTAAPVAHASEPPAQPYNEQ